MLYVELTHAGVQACETKLIERKREIPTMKEFEKRQIHIIVQCKQHRREIFEQHG